MNIQRLLNLDGKVALITGGSHGKAAAPRIAAMDRLMDWLPAHLPVGNDTAVARLADAALGASWHGEAECIADYCRRA